MPPRGDGVFRRVGPNAREQWRTFTFRERLSFCSAWTPDPPMHGTRWHSYGEFLADYRRVRDEARRRWHREPFGERVLRYHGRHGAAALDAATYEQIKYDDAD